MYVCMSVCVFVLLKITLVHSLLTFYFYCGFTGQLYGCLHIVVVFAYYMIFVVVILQYQPRECSSLETHEVTKFTKWQTTTRRKLRINAFEERREFACVKHTNIYTHRHIHMQVYRYSQSQKLNGMQTIPVKDLLRWLATANCNFDMRVATIHTHIHVHMYIAAAQTLCQPFTWNYEVFTSL